jgi:hypothetical protein
LNGIQILPEWFQESCGRNYIRNARNGIRSYLQRRIDRRRLPTLYLGVINKQILVLPLPPPSSTTPMQRRRVTTVTNGRQYHKTTTRAPRHRPRPTPQPHVSQGRSRGQVPRRCWRRGNLTNNARRRSWSLTIG